MLNSATLIALHAPISNGALRGENLPTRLKLLNWGENASAKGPVRVGEMTVTKLREQGPLGFGRVALDFEHNTVPGSTEFERTKEPRAVAGYGAPEVVPGDGLYLGAITWTPEGQRSAPNFEDLSPAVKLDRDGNVTFIHSVALTRNGAVEGLSFFSSQPNDMNDQTHQDCITVADLAPAIGLSAGAKKADVLGKLTLLSTLAGLVTMNAKGEPELTGLNAVDSRLRKLEDANTRGIATLSATVDGKTVTLNGEDMVKLGTRLDTIERGLAAVEKARTDRERTDLIARFTADGQVPVGPDGKAYSAEGLAKLDLVTLQVLHANTPATVPLQARGRVASADSGEAKGAERAARAWGHLNA